MSCLKYAKGILVRSSNNHARGEKTAELTCSINSVKESLISTSLPRNTVRGPRRAGVRAAPSKPRGVVGFTLGSMPAIRCILGILERSISVAVFLSCLDMTESILIHVIRVHSAKTSENRGLYFGVATLLDLSQNRRTLGCEILWISEADVPVVTMIICSQARRHANSTSRRTRLGTVPSILFLLQPRAIIGILFNWEQLAAGGRHGSHRLR